MRAGHRQRVAVGGGQTPLPRRLSLSVIDAVGSASIEFARNADYEWQRTAGSFWGQGANGPVLRGPSVPTRTSAVSCRGPGLWHRGGR
jgi:hypothetical protein